MMIPGNSGLAMPVARRPARVGPAPRRQAGAVLVVALLFLLIITMLGVTSMQSTTSEERMAGNTRDYNNAFQAAEAALRDAWYDIKGECAPGAVSGCVQRSPAISGATNFGNLSNLTPGASAGTCSTTGLCMPNGTYPRYTLLNTADWGTTGSSPVNPVSYGTYTLSGTDIKFPTSAGALAGTMAAQAQQLVAQQPQYIIEALCMPDATASLGGIGCPKYYYRITARGYGGNANTQVTLQMVVRL